MSTRRGFTITKDHLNTIGIANREGKVLGFVRGVSAPPVEEMPTEFRAYDDDNELYYEGRCSPDDEALQTMYDWLQNDSGVTSLEIREAGEETWEAYP